MATSATASARMPPTPSITVMPNCGSSASPAISSRLPRSIGATSTPTSPSSGGGRGQQVGGRGRTASASARPSRTRPRSVLWAMASPHSLATTGIADRRPRPTAAASGSATTCSAGMGTPCAARSALDSASDRVRVPRIRVVDRHGCVPYSAMSDASAERAAPRAAVRGHRGLLRPAVVLGRPGRGDGVVPRAGHDALRLRAEGRSAAPRALAGALRRARSSPASPGWSAPAPSRSASASPPACRSTTGRPTTATRWRPRSTSSLAVGVGTIALLLDDIPLRPGLGADHAELTAWLREHLADRAYAGADADRVRRAPRSTAYLDALRRRRARRGADRLDRAARW